MTKSRFQIGDFRPDMSEEEAKQFFEGKSEEELTAFLEETKKVHARAEAMVVQRASVAKQQFKLALRYAEDRLAYAETQLADVEGTRDRFKAFQDDAEGAYHYNNLSLLCQLFTATRTMMAVEAACARHNLGMVELTGIPSDPKWGLRLAIEEVDYREARSRQDVALALFATSSQREGVEIVLRAVFNEPAYRGTPAEEATRQERADALKAAMKGDMKLAQAVTQIATDVQDAIALAEWGKVSLQTLGQLPLPARRKALDDPDWAKLNGKVLALGEVAAKAASIPGLAPYFPLSQTAPLPYEQIAWDEAPKRPPTGPVRPGVGRMGPPGGTGPKASHPANPGRASQTGRLPNQPGPG